MQVLVSLKAWRWCLFTCFFTVTMLKRKIARKIRLFTTCIAYLYQFHEWFSVVAIILGRCTIQTSEWIGMILMFLTLDFHQSSQHKKIRFTSTGFVWLNIWASINPGFWRRERLAERNVDNRNGGGGSVCQATDLLRRWRGKKVVEIKLSKFVGWNSSQTLNVCCICLYLP